MPISMLCYQCGAPAERCRECGNALCKRRLCMELHEASCAGMSRLPSMSSGRSRPNGPRGPRLPSDPAAPSGQAGRDDSRRTQARRDAGDTTDTGAAPSQHGQHGQHGQSGQHGQPGQRGESGQSNELSQSSGSGQSGEPGEHAEPGQRREPGQHGQHGYPAQPGQLGQGGAYADYLGAGPSDSTLDFPPTPPRPPASRRQRPERDVIAERLIVEQLVARITQHRQAGRDALVAGELDHAFEELWAARQLEPDLDRFGAVARASMPRDWELETDLVPLARALSARMHPHAVEAWCHVLDDAPARSIQAEAAEWLARHAFGAGQARRGLRRLHAASLLGRGLDAPAFQAAYRQAGLDPVAAFNLYLTATRLDPRSARAAGLRDPLTGELWADQDARWWLDDEPWHSLSLMSEPSDPQLEAFHRASDLAQSKRDHGWLLLAEGDYLAGPLGARTLGRNLRTGCAEPADQDTFIRIRLAYESAADRLPDVAWPWYRLAELLAWAGFAERAAEHLAQAERRSVGPREAERTQRPLLRALVRAGLGSGPDGLATAARPFPAEPFGVSLAARFGLR